MEKKIYFYLFSTIGMCALFTLISVDWWKGFLLMIVGILWGEGYNAFMKRVNTKRVEEFEDGLWY